MTTPTGPTGFSAEPLTPSDPTRVPPAGLPLRHDAVLVQGAIDDLAERLGVPRSTVTVVDARTVTWGDTSLGCPKPGMGYLQRLTDGALVLLEAGGRRYEYHGGDPLALCEHPGLPPADV